MVEATGVLATAGLGSQAVAALAISPVGSRTLWASVNNAVEQDLGGGIKFFFPGNLQVR